MNSAKKIFDFFLTLYRRINSPFFSIHNLYQLLKNTDKRQYIAKDPLDSFALISPTFSQMNAMRKEILQRKQHYQGIQKLAEQNGGKIIIDIGANIGYYSRACSHYCKDLEIISIEPSIKNLSFCSMNLRDRHNVSIFHLGLGETFGRFDLAIPEYANDREGENKSNTGLLSAIGNTSPMGTRFFEFDSFCSFAEIDFNNIAWIKIDVEGFELNVLKGMKELLLKTNAAIEIELNCQTLNLSQTTFNEMLSVFNSFNFIPMRNKDINPNTDIPNLIVLDLVFVKKNLMQASQEHLELVEFTENEIYCWNEAFKSEFGF